MGLTIPMILYSTSGVWLNGACHTATSALPMASNHDIDRKKSTKVNHRQSRDKTIPPTIGYPYQARNAWQVVLETDKCTDTGTR